MADYETHNLRATLAILGAHTILGNSIVGLTADAVREFGGGDATLDEVRGWLAHLEDHCLAECSPAGLWYIRHEGLVALWTELPWEDG